LKTIFGKLPEYFRTRLHWQISLPLLFFLIFVGASGSYVLRIVVQNNLKTEFLHRGEFAAHSIQYAVESASILGGIQRYLAALGAEDGVDLVVVVAGTPARVIASTKRVLTGQEYSTLPDVNVRDVLGRVLGSRAPYHEFDQVSGHLAYASPVLISNVVSEGVPLGEGALLIKMQTDELVAAVNDTLWTLSTLFIVLLMTLAGILLLLVRRHVLRPQQRLLETVKARQKGEKVLTSIEGENEFAQLGEAFNEMLRVTDSVDRLKGEFVSTVSHELRTPLTSIRGAVGLVLGNSSDSLPENVRELLVMANRNIERLTLLVNDILDLEKIESGKLEFNFVPLDLVELARNALESNAAYANEHQVRLRLAESPSQAGVTGDESRLLQVFANLLSNAIKYSPAGGEVDVLIRQSDDRFRVSIKDHGKGIPDEFRARIFQRFAQADSSDTRAKGGTGLGLNISKVIVERHTGVIGYVTRPDVGTEFYCELPIREDSLPGVVNKPR
jgi:signal transduction histidine kinase